MKTIHSIRSMRTGQSTRRSIAVLLLAGACSAVPAAAQSGADTLLVAMHDEIARSMKRMALAGAEKPYFISYLVKETETYNIEAAFGSLLESQHNRTRTLAVDVRVGDMRFDNSGFLRGSDIFRFGDDDHTSLVTDNSYVGIRRDLWLATDDAYKRAIERLAAKRAVHQNNAKSDTLPDFSASAPVAMVAPREELHFNAREWDERLRMWSGIFRKYPQIQSSEITLQVTLTHTYVVSSEGASVRQPKLVLTLTATARAQAPDGSRITNRLPITAARVEGMPSPEEIERRITVLAQETTALRNAPLMDESYVGPVLVTDAAAASLIDQLFGRELSGERPPEMEHNEFGPMAGHASSLADRVGRSIVARTLSAVDDPTQTAAAGTPLFGTYAADDQGVAAQRVTLVENGTLKDLATSRRPRTVAGQSNGHGRSGGGAMPRGTIGNLIVTAADGLSYDDLKRKMIELCTSRGLQYGIVISSLSQPGEGEDDDMQIIINGMGEMGGSGRNTISDPVIIRKVYTDGHEELVRGASIREMDIGSLRRIAAAGSDANVLNTMRHADGPPSFAPSSGIPVSIVAPTLLFDELELQRSKATAKKPALLTNPYFEK